MALMAWPATLPPWRKVGLHLQPLPLSALLGLAGQPLLLLLPFFSSGPLGEAFCLPEFPEENHQWETKKNVKTLTFWKAPTSSSASSSFSLGYTFQLVLAQMVGLSIWGLVISATLDRKNCHLLCEAGHPSGNRETILLLRKWHFTEWHIFQTLDLSSGASTKVCKIVNPRYHNPNMLEFLDILAYSCTMDYCTFPSLNPIWPTSDVIPLPCLRDVQSYSTATHYLCMISSPILLGR